MCSTIYKEFKLLVKLCAIQLVFLLDICLGCKMDGGVGYTNHPTSCDRFVVCYPTDGGNVKPVTQLCPYGLFWSQTALTCRLTKDVYCPHGTSTFYLTMHIKRHIISSYIATI